MDFQPSCLRNLRVRHPDDGPGLSFVYYAPLAEMADESHSMGIARRELHRHNQTSSNRT